MDKVVLWGVGRHCLELMAKYLFPLDDIEAIIDINYEKMKDIRYFDKTVSAPESIITCESKIVVVGSKDYYNEISSIITSFSRDKMIILLDDYIKRYPTIDSTTSYFAWHMKNSRRQNYLINQMRKLSDLPKESFENAKIFSNRIEALDVLPKHGIAAEIGVAYGWFSDEILSHMLPKHFYAIDYFNKDNPYISMWGNNFFEESGLPHEKWYRNKYHALIEEGKMSICSGISWDELRKFDDDFFDYIYIDAGHDYDSVRKDIDISMKKIKNNGYIQFNDYTLQSILDPLGTCYGVIPAVNEMIIATKSRIVGLCFQKLGYYDLLVQINK